MMSILEQGHHMPDANRIQQAQTYCRRALDHYEKNNRAAAIKALGMALDLDRSLHDDPRIQRFAARLINLPAEQALTTLADRSTRDALVIQLGKRTTGKSRLQSNPLWIFGTVMLALTFMIVVGLVATGRLTLNTLDPSANQGQVERHQLETNPEQEYFVAAPIGKVPADGWQVVVAVHGAGQTGQDMVDILGETTRSRGLLLIAPTINAIRDGKSDNNTYQNGRATLRSIMEEVKRAGMTNPKLYPHYLGQVYLGYSEGGSLVTYLALNGLDYAESGYALEEPLGVIVVNGRAPLFDAPLFPLPYLLLSGELAAQAAISRDYHKRLTNQGVEVYLEAAAGADTTMTKQQLTIMADFVEQVFYPPPGFYVTATP